MAAKARIDRLVTSGTFSLDGQDFDVDNNVWLIGDDAEVFVVDAAHDATAIRRAVGDRRLLGVISTHGHNDHVNGALDVAAGARDSAGAPDSADASGSTSAPDSAAVYLHPDDLMLW